MIGMMRDREPVKSQRPLVPVMPSWVIWAGAVMFPLLALGLMGLLLLHFGSGTPRDRIQLDVIKTAGGIVVGTGGAIALLLNARRQRSAEIALRLQDADVAQKELAAEDTRHDAKERRITELYNSAVEQLGSDKAPVRLGGLYALERLAQDNPGTRPTVVEVLCAYLRMPDPDEDLGEVGIGEKNASEQTQRQEEHQVRRAAQHILTRHLRPFDAIGEDCSKFWPDIEIDLNGAVLHNWDFTRCRVAAANFSKAKFRGRRAVFAGALSQGRSWFNAAQFCGEGMFAGVEFSEVADFMHCSFEGATHFGAAKFSGGAMFDFAEFFNTLSLSGARADSSVSFTNTSFHGRVGFDVNDRYYLSVDRAYVRKKENVNFLPSGFEVIDMPKGERVYLENYQLIVKARGM